MARASWKGTLSMGLFSLKVKTIKAIGQKQSSNFQRRHKGCGGRMGYKKYCKDCGEEMEYSETYKAYKVGKNNVVKVPEKKLKEIGKKTSEIEVLGIVKTSRIPDFHFKTGKYLLTPEDDSDKERYKQLLQALQLSNQVLLAKWSYRNRDRLVAIRPIKDRLFVFRMLYEDRIRERVINEDLKLPEADEEDVKTLIKYMEKKVGGIQIDNIKSDYNEKLKDMIRKLSSGEKVEVEEKGEKVNDKIMEKVKQAVAE